MQSAAPSGLPKVLQTYVAGQCVFGCTSNVPESDDSLGAEGLHLRDEL